MIEMATTKLERNATPLYCGKYCGVFHSKINTVTLLLTTTAAPRVASQSILKERKGK
jgi:hypothetical protein